MRIKRTTITIEEEPYSGNVRLSVVVHHSDGESHSNSIVHLSDYKSDENKIKVLTKDIFDTLTAYREVGTLEE